MRGVVGGLIALLALAAACSQSARASTDADGSPPKVCIVFEDSSFMCGYSDPDGGWIDRMRPYVVGCIPGPDAGCGSRDEE